MLGTLIESALSTIGITSERVEKWLGAPCGCQERRDKLDQISHWAIRIVKGKVSNAREYLSGIIGENESSNE